jgi:antitoxin (DNA-binding transcriptional repressor) of toxin-antitoxin stability system
VCLVRRVNLKYAKDHLESLVDEAIAGEEVMIASKGSRLVRLAPVQDRGTRTLETASRRAAVEALCSRLQTLPDLDNRTTDEILGYNDRGLFE